MNGSIPLLGSSSLIIVPAEEIKDKKKKIKKIKFQDNQVCLIIIIGLLYWVVNVHVHVLYYM